MQFKGRSADIALGVLLVMVVGLLGVASISWAGGYGWTTKADMPTARMVLSTSVMDGKIYAIGGMSHPPRAVLSTVEEYDPVTDTWTTKASMPTGARYLLSTSAVNGKIYAIGGWSPENRFLSTVEEYDPVTDTWTTKADMPMARSALSTSVVNGKIYAIGGILLTGGPSTVEEYDPVTDTWTTKASMPTAARYLLSTSAVNGKIYAIGGAPGHDLVIATVEAYDPATDSWTTKADMPTARSTLSTSVVNGKIYAIGGALGMEEAVSTVEEYDPSTDTWTTKADMPTARMVLSTSVVNGKIYAIGGNDVYGTRGSLFSTVEKYDLAVGMEMERLSEGLISASEMFGTWIGQPTLLDVTVVLDAPLETTESLRKMSLDLSPLGIPSGLPLEHVGDGRYTGSTAVTPLRNGHYDLPIMVETAEEERYAFLRVMLDVYPDGDLSIYEDGPSDGWTVEVTRAESDPTSSRFVHSGSSSHAILLQTGVVPGTVKYVFDDPKGIDLFGYTHLELYIHGGDASGQDPAIGGMKLSDLGIMPESDTWTLVSVPVSEVRLDKTSRRLTSILITGMVKETFYIDDMKLVAQEPPEPTAVETSEMKAIPSGYALCQNVPNPFNPLTTIAYDLPEASNVILTIYTITGQKMATVVSDHQEVGHYEVAWDGSGFASGIYFYRLKAGQFAETKRMLLLK